MPRLGEHAVVVGGSMAGLLAARVLADHYDRVTILDRDRLPDAAEARKGTPQARHVHVLLMAGRRVLDRLLPDVVPDLIAAGAEDYDFLNDIEWVTGAGPAVRFPSDVRMLGATRDLIELGVRRAVLAYPRVSVRNEVDATGVRLAEGRVAALALVDRSGSARQTEEVAADLVVDAAGRASRLPTWLEAAGYPRPRETVVNGFLGYATRFVQPPPGWTDWKSIYVQTAPPKRCRGGVIALMEGGRWIVSLVGGGKDYPPTDEAGFLAFARSLDDPRFAAAYEAATPLTPIAGTKSTENRIRHYEDVKHRPEGLLALGDAVCAFNPVYGQGMSAAALGAEMLARCLRSGLAGLAGRFQKALAQSNARPWLLAAGEDYRYTQVEGPPAGWTTRWTHGYLDRIIALTTHSKSIRRKFTEVVHLIRSPASLFTPDILLRAAFTRA